MIIILGVDSIVCVTISLFVTSPAIKVNVALLAIISSQLEALIVIGVVPEGPCPDVPHDQSLTFIFSQPPPPSIVQSHVDIIWKDIPPPEDGNE